APIKKGDKVGDIIVQFNNNIVSSKPLYALQTVESGGFYTRTKDSIRLAFKRWFGS
ncbi:TPA: serine-type D-Ala-D-Ala carboxypeptidase, partial [Legionella pneumophila]|nr:serine-type D-Ala-D-Ala carboxypeptidase [Legionella pneumophila]HEO1499298.1 serine-type D-Ala-D-Ala carboxypeptidase [Legionella pneumophila]